MQGDLNLMLIPLKGLTRCGSGSDDDVLRVIGLVVMASESGTSGLPRSWSQWCTEAELCVTLETSLMHMKCIRRPAVAESISASARHGRESIFSNPTHLC